MSDNPRSINSFSRRDFLKSALAAAGALFLPDIKTPSSVNTKDTELRLIGSGVINLDNYTEEKLKISPTSLYIDSSTFLSGCTPISDLNLDEVLSKNFTDRLSGNLSNDPVAHISWLVEGDVKVDSLDVSKIDVANNNILPPVVPSREIAIFKLRSGKSIGAFRNQDDYHLELLDEGVDKKAEVYFAPLKGGAFSKNKYSAPIIYGCWDGNRIVLFNDLLKDSPQKITPYWWPSQSLEIGYHNSKRTNYFLINKTTLARSFKLGPQSLEIFRDGKFDSINSDEVLYLNNWQLPVIAEMDNSYVFISSAIKSEISKGNKAHLILKNTNSEVEKYDFKAKESVLENILNPQFTTIEITTDYRELREKCRDQNINPEDVVGIINFIVLEGYTSYPWLTFRKDANGKISIEEKDLNVNFPKPVGPSIFESPHESKIG